MNEIELRHLRCLVTLAEERNFGRAAARLHMSQPPLTRLLFDVEHSLGVKLFERTTRRVALTPTGAVFIAEAQAVLARAESAMETVRAAARRESGQLRLAYTPLALQTVLPKVVSRLREQEHDVSIDLIELTGDAQREALLNGQVDMGFSDEPVPDENFRSLLLRTEPLQVVLPGDHTLTKERSLRLADLAGETLILHARPEYPRYFDRVVGACKEAGFTPRIYERKAGQNCLALVSAGQGVLLAPANSSHGFTAGYRGIPLKSPPAALRLDVWAVLPRASGSAHLESLRRIIGEEALTDLDSDREPG